MRHKRGRGVSYIKSVRKPYMLPRQDNRMGIQYSKTNTKEKIK